MSDPRTTGDIERRLANLIRIGVVEQLDESTARVRVRAGGILTAPLPWLTHRAGPQAVDWWAPTIGTQVVVLAPSGELAQAVVLPAIYQNAFAAPGDADTLDRIVYADGTVLEYDVAASKLTATVAGEVVVSASGKVTVASDTKVVVSAPDIAIGSDESADPVVRQSDLQAAIDGIKAIFDAHTHAGVTPGGGTTATPLPQLNVTAQGSPSVSAD